MQKILQIINELLDKISILFKRYGIKIITMDDIAHELCISKKTLYQYFKNKSDVVEKFARFELKSELDQLKNIYQSQSNPIEQFLTINRYLTDNLRNFNPSLNYDLNKYYPKLCNELSIQRKTQIILIIKQNLHSGVEQGLYLKSINPDIISSFYMMGLEAKVFELYFNEFKENFDEISDTLLIYYIRGIATDIGIKYLQDKIKLIK